jgi:hypothetical protein
MDREERESDMSFRIPVGVAGLSIVIVTAAARGEVVTVGASADNTLYEDPAGAISNGAGAHLFAGMTGAGLRRRGLIAFDVAGTVPAGASIDGVTLTLHASQGSLGSPVVGLHRALASWGEGASDAPDMEGQGAPAAPGDATWIHRMFDTTMWTTPGGDFDALASATIAVDGPGFWTWTSRGMVDDVQAWLDAPAADFGWLLRGDESMPVTSRRFDSRENGEASFRPALEITYTPLPAPGGLALLLAGLVTRRARRG